MAKPVRFIFTICLFLLFTGCSGNKKKSEEIKNYTYQEERAALSPRLQAKLGEWIEEGMVCYGLVVGVDKGGNLLNGKTVKAKVISLANDSIKVKAMEMVSLAEVKGCTKMGLSKGEIWWEKEGDLFRTREEAAAWLSERGLLKTK